MANEPLPEKYKQLVDFDYPKHKAEHATKRPPMPISKRAAQFSAFKALNGMDHIYTDAEKEHKKSLEEWENRKY